MTDEYAVDAAQIDAARAMLAALEAIKSLTDTGEPDWNDAIGDHAERAIAAAKQAGLDAARDGTNPSSDLHLHLSSERRREVVAGKIWAEFTVQRLNAPTAASWADAKAYPHLAKAYLEIADIALSADPPSERRRGLEEAAKIADAWCEKNHWPNGVWGIAASIRALLSPSSEGGEET